MKSIWMGSLALLAACPALANPDAPRDARGAGAGAERATVMPISVDGGEARPRNRLRETLRQPFDDMDGGSPPYRLSVEERQRLREQLRGQPLDAAGRKP